MSSGSARLRIDVHGSKPCHYVLETMTFLNYRLANVNIEPTVTRPKPDIVWDQDVPTKDIFYKDGTMTLHGEWFPGELQKILVSMIALKVEEVGLHPFHSSAIRYRGLTILFLGGESNHGKSMAQIEGSRRGALVVSTETTVTDERGWVVMGSKNVFLRERAKGTERADKLDQDQGVAKFFDKAPEFVNYDEPSNVDLVVVPSIDGNFDPKSVAMIPFERNFQTFHSLMEYLGVKEALAPGIAMPLLDNDALRAKRIAFCKNFTERPYYLIRAKNPRVLFDQLEEILDKNPALGATAAAQAG
ncbi:MAG: hypothetical protein ACLQKY_17075 [Terracidiphilus sp.]